MYDIAVRYISEVAHILVESSFFILTGILLAGLLKVVLNPGTVLNHLGNGKYRSVIKASLLGIPLPL